MCHANETLRSLMLGTRADIEAAFVVLSEKVDVAASEARSNYQRVGDQVGTAVGPLQQTVEATAADTNQLVSQVVAAVKVVSEATANIRADTMLTDASLRDIAERMRAAESVQRDTPGSGYVP